jgi:hypothetical protein
MAPDHRDPASGEQGPVRVRTSEPARHRRSVGWWYAGMVLDLVHMPLVIGLVVFGASIWRGQTYVTVVTIVVIVQVATLGCPVMALTGWMKRRYDPAYAGEWSFTFWLYHRYGRLIGIGVFVFFLCAATLMRLLAF